MSDDDIESISTADGFDQSMYDGSEDYNPNESYNDVSEKAVEASSFQRKAYNQEQKTSSLLKYASSPIYSNNDDYDDDFENASMSSQLESPKPMSDSNYNRSSIVDSISKSHISKILPGVPSAVNSIQAELALDEISKEVLRLRNQQRAVLKDRQQVAKQKKNRADERRLKYTEELKKYSDRTIAAESESSTLKETIDRLQMKSDSSDILLKEKEATILSLHTASRAVENQLIESRANIDTLTIANAALLKEIDGMREKFKLEKEDLEIQMKQKDLHIIAIESLIKLNDERIKNERDNLPEFHKNLVNDQLERLKQLEVSLQDREGALKMEEARKLSQIESIRKEQLEDFVTMRRRVDMDLLQQKESIDKNYEVLQKDIARWSTKYAEETSALDQRTFAMNQRVKEFNDEMAEFEKQKTEFDIKVRMIDPVLQSIDEEKKEARRIKMDANTIMKAAEDHASSILEAERGLMQKEKMLVSAGKEIEMIRSKVICDHQNIIKESNSLKNFEAKLENERFRLHQLAVELSQQSASFRNLSSSSSSATSSASLSIQPPFKHEENLSINGKCNQSSSSLFSSNTSSRYQIENFRDYKLSPQIDAILFSLMAPISANDHFERQTIDSKLIKDITPRSDMSNSLTLLSSHATDLGDENGASITGIDHDIDKSCSLLSSIEDIDNATQNLRNFTMRFGIV